MTTSRKLLFVLGPTLLVLACATSAGPATQIGSVSTIVAATLQALTPASPIPTQASANTASPSQAASQGLPVTFANVNLILPNGLASGAAGENVPAVSDPNGPIWDVAPAYIRFTLQGYPLQNTLYQPMILIYPAQDYAAVSPGAQISLQRLQAILASPAAPLTNDLLPRLPFANADQMIGGAPKIVSFQNGSGVRVVTMYGQAVGPINNHDLFYHYEGLSTDGKYYVVTTLPVKAPILAASNDPAAPVPTGGVSFPGYNVTDPTEFNTYFQAVTDKLSAAAPESFMPTLTDLDALIQSVRITP